MMLANLLELAGNYEDLVLWLIPFYRLGSQ